MRYTVGVAETLPPKKEVARTLLLRGSVFVHLDPRPSGVSVPPWLRNQAQLVLQIGLDMPIPIPDLRVDDEGVYGTLSFQRSPYTCVVPWEAIFALVGEDGRGMVWPDSMPPEITAEIEREVGRRRSDGKKPKPPGGTRRKSRRDEDTRPVAQQPALAAVPEPADEPDETARVTPLRVVADRGAGASRKKAPAAVSTDRDKEKKRGKKPRELPPYLRVIK